MIRLTLPVLILVQLQTPIENTPIVLCIGLNYKQHAQEANVNGFTLHTFSRTNILSVFSQLPVPNYPTVFTKPADALAGPFDAIDIHPYARELLDYEGELTVVIGRDAKNV